MIDLNLGAIWAMSANFFSIQRNMPNGSRDPRFSCGIDLKASGGSNLALGILPLLPNPLIQLTGRGTREFDLNH